MAILYKGGVAAEEEPRLLGTVENKLGIEQWCKENNHESVNDSKLFARETDVKAHCHR